MTTDDRLLPSYLNKQRGQLTQPRSVGSQIKNHTANIRDEIERRDRLISAHQQQIIDGSAVLAAKDAEIERLRREVASFRETLRVERDCRLNETRLKDQYRTRALTAESAVAAAMEALKPFEEAYEAACYGDGVPDDFDIWESPAAMSITVGDLRRASAIRAAGAEKTAESGHSPSTHNSESE